MKFNGILIIIGYECMHALRIKQRKKWSITLKLDMSKAYNRVEWGFLAKIMIKLGFSGIWVQQVMDYVTTISYSFLLNGTTIGSLCSTRGLR